VREARGVLIVGILLYSTVMYIPSVNLRYIILVIQLFSVALHNYLFRHSI